MNCPICDHKMIELLHGYWQCENNKCPWLKHQHERYGKTVKAINSNVRAKKPKTPLDS